MRRTRRIDRRSVASVRSSRKTSLPAAAAAVAAAPTPNRSSAVRQSLERARARASTFELLKSETPLRGHHRSSNANAPPREPSREYRVARAPLPHRDGLVRRPRFLNLETVVVAPARARTFPKAAFGCRPLRYRSLSRA